MDEENQKRAASGAVTDEAQLNEGPGLERIREILFGPGHRDLQRRMLRVHGQLDVRLIELEQEMRRRVELLEAHVKQETEAVAARLEAQLGTQAETLRELAREQHAAVAELERKLEQKLTRVEEGGTRGQRDLRRQLLEQGKGAIDELHRLRQELMRAIHDELEGDEGDASEAGSHEPEAQRRH